MADNLNLEHIHTDDGALARNFDKLRSLSIDTGGQSVGIRFGTGTVTWPGGSRFTNVLTVSHGLGRTPTAVLLGSAGGNTHIAHTNVTTASFQAVGNTIDGSSPAAASTASFSWIAIG